MCLLQWDVYMDFAGKQNKGKLTKKWNPWASVSYSQIRAPSPRGLFAPVLQCPQRHLGAAGLGNVSCACSRFSCPQCCPSVWGTHLEAVALAVFQMC